MFGEMLVARIDHSDWNSRPSNDESISGSEEISCQTRNVAVSRQQLEEFESIHTRRARAMRANASVE